MPVFTVPVHEANDCHHPAGSPVGGQFCSKQSWHLTDNPSFVPDPNRPATLNRVRLSDFVHGVHDKPPTGLFVSDRPEYWLQAYGYERPYIAQVEGQVTNDPGAVWLSSEGFMQGAMKTVRVLTLDEYVREVFGEPGWVEEFFNEGPSPKIPKNYVARTVAQMTPAERKDWETRFSLWTRRPDGPSRAEMDEEERAASIRKWKRELAAYEARTKR